MWLHFGLKWAKMFLYLKKISIQFLFQFPNVPYQVLKKMSKDQRDLYELCQVVMTGVVTRVVEHKLGKCILYRWLTLASRILRLYISQVSSDSSISCRINQTNGQNTILYTQALSFLFPVLAPCGIENFEKKLF